MASFWYQIAGQQFLTEGIHVTNDTIKARIYADEDHTASAAHTTMSSVIKYVGSTDYTLTSVTATNGVLDAANGSPAYTSLALNESDDVDGIIVFQFITDDAGSDPMVHIDLSTSYTPDGNNVNITWDASGIADIV